MGTTAKIRLIAALAMALVAVVWILQNVGAVETRFLFFTLTMPLPVLLALTLLVGIATGILLAWSLSGKARAPKKEPPAEPGAR